MFGIYTHTRTRTRLVVEDFSVDGGCEKSFRRHCLASTEKWARNILMFGSACMCINTKNKQLLVRFQVLKSPPEKNCKQNTEEN